MSSGPFRDNQSFSDSAKVSESISIKKWNFISYEGFKIFKPYRTVLFEGKKIYFKDASEFSRFCSERFTEREQDRCPVCGEAKGRHLRYVFATGNGLPFELFVCSKECLRKLTQNISVYREILEEIDLPVTHGSDKFRDFY